MKNLLTNMSISKRYVLYLCGVITSLLTGFYIINGFVIQDGMRELYQQRLLRCGAIIEQYSEVHYVTKMGEIEAVLSSPRFIAAVATGDNQTIANEIPYYQDLLRASFIIIQDNKSEVVYSTETQKRSETLDSSLYPQLKTALFQSGEIIQSEYLLIDTVLLETFIAEIITHDGSLLGKILIGSYVSDFMIDDLERLTGFDIIISQHNKIVARSESRQLDKMLASSNSNRFEFDLISQIISLTDDEYESMYISELIDEVNLVVTCIGLPGEQIAPIMKRSRFLLISLALFGGLLALGVVYLYTTRSLGRQIDTLIDATDKISRGTLDFELNNASKGELGVLTKAINNMRGDLLANRDEIDQLHRQHIEIERLASVGTSATGIIHDFKSPMAVIRGTVEMLSLKHTENEKLSQKLATITDQVDRMNELALDVIEFSRGKFNLHFQTIDFTLYIQSICAAQRESFDKNGVNIKLTDTPNVAVSIDPKRFRRVIDNILNNAREALKPGQQVSLGWTPDVDGLNFVIADNGPGIPSDIVETLFEPFVTSGKEGGTGLGLAIAKRIIDDHNATIDVHASSKGTTFNITIPKTLIKDSDTTKILTGQEEIYQ